ncbi:MULTISPECIES: hypothetical protein [Hyphomicrobiales]|uniref:hypothetical protein n=1 Tax=Hyphomicrobiales TaxID=356 RepID=UPI0025BB8877|nr:MULTISPECIES: hypothetical protein [Hyphomicrobiales]MBX3559892.1 hypothetical protein [Chelatococcus sp.]MCO5154794.1 hypothetical protein [Shinella sp.]
MALVEIPVPPELTAALEESFRQGAMWNEDGLRLLTEDLVAKVGSFAGECEILR